MHPIKLYTMFKLVSILEYPLNAKDLKNWEHMWGGFHCPKYNYVLPNPIQKI